MSLIRGLFVRKDATRGTTPVEARKALAGLLTPAGAFGARRSEERRVGKECPV